MCDGEGGLILKCSTVCVMGEGVETEMQCCVYDGRRAVVGMYIINHTVVTQVDPWLLDKKTHTSCFSKPTNQKIGSWLTLQLY